jgi:hypothetical protein
MYWDEHNPPYFHAEYAEFKAIVSIKESVVVKGVLPAKHLKLVLAWCEIHRDELLKNWDSAQKNGEITKIEPLK